VDTKLTSFFLFFLVMSGSTQIRANSLIYSDNNVAVEFTHSEEAIYSNSERNNTLYSSDLFLDLSKSKFSTSGQRTSNKIMLHRKKFRLGTSYSKSSLQAHIEGAFVGNSDAVFSDFSTQTSVNLDQESIGVFIGKEMFSNNKFVI
jgi:hypothetical protein